MIIHNRGWGPQAEDALFVDEITGHYRYMAAPDEASLTTAGAPAPAGTCSTAFERRKGCRQAVVSQFEITCECA